MKQKQINKIEQQKKHFNSISEQYYHSRQDKNHLYYKSLLWSHFFSLADVKDLKDKNIKVLEPMCGYAEGGKIIESYLTKDFHYEGFDISENIIKKVEKENPSFKTRVEDISNFNETKKYDLVILIGGLHHVPHITKDSLKRVYNSLKDGGVFINVEPTHNLLLFKLIREFIYGRNKIFDHETEQAYEFKKLNSYYQEVGFSIERQLNFGLLAYILYYNPDAFPLLNKGPLRMVKSLFQLESPFYESWIGRTFSFATLSLLKKQAANHELK